MIYLEMRWCDEGYRERASFAVEFEELRKFAFHPVT